MSTLETDNGMTARNAHADRAKLKRQQEAQQLAQMVAAAITPQATQNVQPVVSLEEFNKLKAELEQAKSLLAAAQQETQQFKPVVLDHQDKVRDQLEVVNDFIQEKLVQNSTARVLNHDMNFELIEYARDRGCYINSREVKSLLERFNVPYKTSNGQYYYIGVELRS